MVTSIETKQEAFRSRLERERKDGGREIASEDVISVAIASGNKPRRVPLVFVVKSQRKLRLKRNEKHYDEDSKENAREDPFEA
ncbi:hypothetical protein Bca4012_020295 [Brassica carinata]